MNMSHRRQQDEKNKDELNKVPRIAMDYLFMSQEDEKASSNPLLVMVDEETGDKYGRAIETKGVGDEGEQYWVVKDCSDELKSWGRLGGEGRRLIMKCDGEASMKAFRDTLGKFHGGANIPESQN